MTAEVIDRIYESAFVPELWPRVLGDMADFAGARAAFLFVTRDDAHHVTASSDLGLQAITPIVASGWIWRCERFRRFMALRHAGFVSDTQMYTDAEKQTDPFYTELLFPRGLGTAAGMVVPLPTGDRFAISVEREHARGPVEPDRIDALDALRPHLARSAVIATRLRLERARTISETLAAIGLAALVIDDHGGVLAANRLIEAMSGLVQWRARGRVALADRAANALLDDAIAAIGHDRRPGVRSFPVRDPDSDMRRVAHLIPVRRSARDVFVSSAAVLILTPIVMPGSAPIELVRSLFDFTPAEARVARELAGGRTVDDIARDGGVSTNTVRTQVRGVLEKTGCGRQADVVALLTTISAVLPQQG